MNFQDSNESSALAAVARPERAIDVRQPSSRRGGAFRVLLSAGLLLAVAATVAWRQAYSHLVPDVWMVDLSVYRSAAHALAEGVSLYDTRVHADLFEEFPFMYPPIAGVLFAPMVLVGKTALSIAAFSLNVLSLVGLFWVTLTMIDVGPRSRKIALTLAGTVLSLPLDAILLNILVGQINIVLTLLILLDLSGIVPRRWRGVATGIASGIKLIPLIFVAYHLCTGRKVVAARAIGTFAGMAALGFVLLPRDSVRYWLNGIFLESSRVVDGSVVNHSLNGLFCRIYGTDSPPVWTFAVSVLVGILGLLLAVHAHRKGHDIVGIVVVAFTSLVVSPLTWPMHSVWVVPALTWLTFARWHRPTLVPKVVLGFSVVFLVVPFYQFAEQLGAGAQVGHGLRYTLTENAWATFGGLLFFSVLLLASVPVWLHRLRPFSTRGDDEASRADEAETATVRPSAWSPS